MSGISLEKKKLLNLRWDLLQVEKILWENAIMQSTADRPSNRIFVVNDEFIKIYDDDIYLAKYYIAKNFSETYFNHISVMIMHPHYGACIDAMMNRMNNISDEDLRAMGSAFFRENNG